MALSNAEKQARWRGRRNALAQRAITEADTDLEIAAKLVKAIGPRRTLAVGRKMVELVRETLRDGVLGRGARDRRRR
jgi:hypothetical protein